MATAKKTEKVIKTTEIQLTLDKDEAQLLADLFGWGICGGGPRYILCRGIYDALKEEGFKYSAARPADFSNEVIVIRG